MSERRVVWRNGDVVGERHFELLESWIVARDELLARVALEPGLVRSPSERVNGMNGPQSVELAEWTNSPRCAVIRLGPLQGIATDGSFFRIEDTIVTDLKIPADVTTRCPVYLTFQYADRSTLPETLEETPFTTGPMPVLGVRPTERGLQIAELELPERERPHLVREFLPSAPRLGGVDEVWRTASDVIRQFDDRVADPCRKFLLSATDPSALRAFAERLVATWAASRPQLDDRWLDTRAYFRTWRSVLGSIAASLVELAVAEPSRAERSWALGVAHDLGGQLYQPEDLRTSFVRLRSLLDGPIADSIRLLPGAPLGPTLALSGIEARSFNQYNRIALQFGGALANVLRGRSVRINIRSAAAGTPLRDADARVSSHRTFVEIEKRQHCPIRLRESLADGAIYAFEYEPVEEDLSRDTLLVYVPKPLAQEACDTHDAASWVSVSLP